MRRGYRYAGRREKPATEPARSGGTSPGEPSRLDREELVPLTAAAAWIADRTGGRRPNVSTLHRWASRGCRGVLLETVFVGHARFTSLEAVRRFFHAKPTTENSTTVVNVAPGGPVAVARATADVAELRRRVFRQR